MKNDDVKKGKTCTNCYYKDEYEIPLHCMFFERYISELIELPEPGYNVKNNEIHDCSIWRHETWRRNDKC
jgi:hypothetical protein